MDTNASLQCQSQPSTCTSSSFSWQYNSSRYFIIFCLSGKHTQTLYLGIQANDTSCLFYKNSHHRIQNIKYQYQYQILEFQIMTIFQRAILNLISTWTRPLHKRCRTPSTKPPPYEVTNRWLLQHLSVFPPEFLHDFSHFNVMHLVVTTLV